MTKLRLLIGDDELAVSRVVLGADDLLVVRVQGGAQDKLEEVHRQLVQAFPQLKSKLLVIDGTIDLAVLSADVNDNSSLQNS